METSSSRRTSVRVMHAEPLLEMGLVASLRAQVDLDVAGRDDPATDRAVDVLVTDYDAGLQFAARARSGQLPRHLAGARVLVVALSDREEEVRSALEHGVHGFLMMGCPLAELVNGVRTVARGSRFLCAGAAQRMADMLTRESLTAREAEVLRLVALGECNKAIARDLAIAVGTVKAHVKAIMGKLDASSRTQAASIAAARGLVSSAWAARVPAMPAGFRAAGLAAPRELHA